VIVFRVKVSRGNEPFFPMGIDGGDTSQPPNGEICMDNSHLIPNNPARQQYRYTSVPIEAANIASLRKTKRGKEVDIVAVIADGGEGGPSPTTVQTTWSSVLLLFPLETRSQKYLREQVFPLLLHKNAKDRFNFEDCRFTLSRSKEATGRIVFRNMGIVNSYTLEASYGGSSIGNKVTK
jgi:hypothetical protein